MQIPASGWVLMPICAFVFLVRPGRLADLAVFVSVFEAASVVNAGRGLSPYFFVTLLIAVRLVPRWLSGRMGFPSNDPVAPVFRTLALLALWGVTSAFILPLVFAGIAVDAPGAGVDESFYGAQALQWSISNAAQAVYLVLNLAMTLELARLSAIPGRLEKLLSAFVGSGIAVVAVGAYQSLCHLEGLPFPVWLFNTNPMRSQEVDQGIAGFHRISASFVEPSSAATFLVSWAVYELIIVTSARRNVSRHWLWVGAGSVILVGTASSTGYVTVAVMLAVIAWDCLAAALRERRLKIRGFLVLAVLVGGLAAAVTMVPGFTDLLYVVVVNKGSSSSAVHRTATFGRAWGVFKDSWGLGAGLGSNRAMSAAFYVLSNLGVPGILLFLLLIWQVRVRTVASLGNDARRRRWYIPIRALAWASLAGLFGHIAAGAEITEPTPWIVLGLLLSAIRRDWMDHGGVAVVVGSNVRPGMLAEGRVAAQA